MKTFLLFLFVALTSVVLAGPVNVNTVKQVARNFCISEFQKQAGNLKISQVVEEHDTVLYYAVNFGNKNGWVAVAATDASYPILAYTDKGDFQSEGQSPAFKNWMNGYKLQLLEIVRQNLRTTAEISQKWLQYSNLTGSRGAKSTTTIGPLLTTTWGQSGYYNDWCPGNCPTGCTATAMAQIMKYWNYPTTGTSDHCYYHASYGELCANFGGTTYNWASMPNVVNSPNTPVATLMYHCGVSVEMDYDPDGSGAWVLTNDPYGYHPNSAQHAYSTYFGYNGSTISGKWRSNFSTTNWINNVLIPELDASRPIQYVGYDLNQEPDAGHTWVCDGYNSNNQFHMNWGWGNTGDNWCYMSDLNPNGSSYHFNDLQQALIGIQPNSTSAPANDNCSNAIMLTSSTSCNNTSGNIQGATQSYPAITCNGYSSTLVQDVWYKFVAVVSTHVVTVTPSSGLDAVLEGKEESCSGSSIGCSDNGGGEGDAEIMTLSGLTPGQTYFVRIYDYTGNGTPPSTTSFNICVTHTGGGGGNVNLEYSGNEIDDDASGGSNGDGDGLCEPGEDIELDVELLNSGSENANNVEGVLSTDDPDITITDANQSWGTILAGETDWTSDFDFSVSADCVDKDVTFTLEITADEGNWSVSFDIHIYGNGGSGSVELAFSQYEIDDDASGSSNGDGDGLCEPGEDIELLVELVNTGSEDANNVTGVLSTTDPAITITDDYQSWGTIAAGGTDWTTDFDFTVATDCQEKDVTFTLEITADEGSWTDSFVIHIYGGSGGTCTECPSFNFDLGCENDWQLHSSEIESEGCKLYRFTVENGAAYIFKTGCEDGATASFDTYLTLLDQNCNEITHDDDNCEDFRSKIEWNSNQPTGTPVFLKVTGYGDEAGTYTLAYKKESTMSYEVTVASNPANGGNVTGGGTYPEGSEVEVQAFANNGYSFLYWTENGIIVSYTSSYSFTLNADHDLVANFESNQSSYTISAYPLPASYGNTYGGGIFPSGTVVNLVAVPLNGYKFEYWIENGNVVCTNSVYTFTVSANRILYAYFSKIDYTDVKEANEGTNGGSKFILFPNPVKESLNIQLLEEVQNPFSLSAYNTEGKLVKSAVPDFISNDKIYRLDVNDLPAGLYFVRIVSKNYTQMLPFIKQ